MSADHGIVMEIDKSKQARKFQIELGYFLLESFLDLFKLFIIPVFVVFFLRDPVKLLHELPETTILSKMSPPGIIDCVSSRL